MLRIGGRIAVGLFTFLLTSVLSLKPPVEPMPPSRSPLAGADNAWVRAQQGLASFYARQFEGRLTASGTRFSNAAMVAAHPHLPFGTIVRVTNLLNGRAVNVRIVDRGPAQGPQHEGVVIDLSRAAAEVLEFIEDGRVQVRLDVLKPAAIRAAGARTATAADRPRGSVRSRAAGSRG